ncbi:MAG: hypothetical protein DDT40_00711 [candidate division WS2 bacterium]|nr:hypothetical protein [Candidatus Psychracetigena formicireducens]
MNQLNSGRKKFFIQIITIFIIMSITLFPANQVWGRSLLKTIANPLPVPFALFGQTMSYGDLDGDGVMEIMVGAEKQRVGDMLSQGKVYVFDSEGNLLFNLTTPTPSDNAFFGSSVLGSDLDGDGKAEILISARGEDVAEHTGAGKLYLFNNSGVLLNVFTSPHPQEFSSFGHSLLTEDINLDGYKDIVVGSPFESTSSTTGTLNEPKPGNKAHGRVYIFSGKDFQLLTTIEPENKDRQLHFGVSLASGDLHNDGQKELIIGATGEQAGSEWEFLSQGEIYIYENSHGDWRLIKSLTTPNPEHNAYFGTSILVSDSSLIIGSPGEMVGINLNQGRVYIYDWNRQTFAHVLSAPKNAPGAGFGQSLSLGDADKDGDLDYIIGAPLENIEDTVKQGMVYVFSGVSKSLLYSFTTPSPENNATFGISLLFLAGVNGNKLYVGSPGENFLEGRLYLYDPEFGFPWWGYIIIIIFLAFLAIYTIMFLKKFIRARNTYLYLMSKRKNKDTEK